MASQIFKIISILFLFTTLVSSQQFQRTINVAGRGTASGPPDLATINTGVVTRAPTAQAALDANTKTFQGILNLLEEQGIDEKDIQTTFFNVNPQGQNLPNGGIGNITSYEVINQVRVIVRQFDNLGKILDALVRAGSNDISGVSFSIANNQPLLDQARTLAVADAKNKAQVLAAAAGLKVGQILSISETPISAPTAVARSFSLQSDAESAVPIAGGELNVVANVFVLFALVA